MSRESIDLHKYHKQKRQRILDKLKPLCNIFHIKNYDYEIIELTEDGYYTSEYLYLDGQQIGCYGSGEEAVFDEVLGYLIVKRYCRNHNLRAFHKQTINYIKRYWFGEGEE